MLIYIKFRIWYVNGSIFQNFPKFESKLAAIEENFGKIGRVLLKIWPKIGPIGKWMSHFFFKKLVFVWVYFQISQRHVPNKTKLEYPTPPGFVTYNSCCHLFYCLFNKQINIASWSWVDYKIYIGSALSKSQFCHSLFSQASKRKVYMLFNLQPDRSVTGGAWYSDQDFESEFVEVLNQQCYKFLQDKVRSVQWLCNTEWACFKAGSIDINKT